MIDLYQDDDYYDVKISLTGELFKENTEEIIKMLNSITDISKSIFEQAQLDISFLILITKPIIVQKLEELNIKSKQGFSLYEEMKKEFDTVDKVLSYIKLIEKKYDIKELIGTTHD